MKYVRTKDGRILRLNEVSEKFFEGKKIFLASTYEELQQADAIEGLCDCYIFFNHSLENIGIFYQPSVMTKEEYEEHRKDMPLEFELAHYNVEYFLGTWTIINNVPKLNIVAKIINSEGESQLL